MMSLLPLMSMYFTRLVACLLVVCVIGLNKATVNAAPPNVLMIMTDDQGWGDLGCHQNPLIETPVLDQLASQSVCLDRFYVSPVCAPTRAALLTGRYPERGGVSGVTRRREVLRAEEQTIAELFAAAGYRTGCFGKWHNGAQMPMHPNGQGFEEFFGFCGGHFNLYDDPLLERNGKSVATKGYITDVITDAAIEFIQQSADRPFLCYVPFNAPHGPFQVPQPLFEKYHQAGKLPEKTAAVYAMVDNIDTNVGRLLATLDQQGLAKNTIVLFLTDNGPNGKRYNGGMRGAKGSVHEGGCRVPCYIRWPQRIEPSKIQQITAHIDLLPTLAGWCDVDLPGSLELDGQDLSQLIAEGHDGSLQDRCLLTIRHQSDVGMQFHRAAARDKQFRLTIENGKPALFDLLADPGQKVDLAKQMPERVAQMRTPIDRYWSEVAASIQQLSAVPVMSQRPTYIPSVEAVLHGKPGFAYGISWAHGWVDNWTEPDDRLVWRIAVQDPGRYEVWLHSVCDSDDENVTATIDQQSVSSQVPRCSNKLVKRPDLDSTSTPRWMLDFKTHSLGTVELTAGSVELSLKRQQAGPMIQCGGVTLKPVAP